MESSAKGGLTADANVPDVALARPPRSSLAHMTPYSMGSNYDRAVKRDKAVESYACKLAIGDSEYSVIQV